ncbi:MAG: hypothetical protein ISS77_07850 [Phycisphaerae bacterium]|nr:hypothetical protein [Phycisphaerae bacterium]
MNKDLIKLALFFLVGLTVSLLLGAVSNTDNNPKYQIVSSGTSPEIFTLDIHTGRLVRYYFYIEGSQRMEKIWVESFGTPDKPEYQLLKKMDGSEWANGLR